MHAYYSQNYASIIYLPLSVSVHVYDVPPPSQHSAILYRVAYSFAKHFFQLASIAYNVAY